MQLSRRAFLGGLFGLGIGFMPGCTKKKAGPSEMQNAVPDSSVQRPSSMELKTKEGKSKPIQGIKTLKPPPP